MLVRLRPLVVLLGLALSCAHGTYHAPEPTVTNGGVALSVVAGQRCFVTRDNERLPPPTNDNRIHLQVTVRIENDSTDVVGVTPGQVRLRPRAPARSAQTELAPLGSTAVSVLPGEIRILPLDFQGPGPVDCRHPMDLDPRDAVTMAEWPVALPPIRLYAAR